MISFVYFDVGGVVVDDFSGNDKWEQLKLELGITKKNEAAFEEIWEQNASRLNLDLDTETLLDIFKIKLGLQLPRNYSLLNGFVKRFYAKPSIWPIIEEVTKHVRVGLLTNMYPGMFAAISRKDIMPKVEWDVVLDSSIELLQKPDQKLFELAEERAEVKGQDILFIDNGKEHIRAAADFGWRTYWYDSSNHKRACSELAKFLQLYNLG